MKAMVLNELCEVKVEGRGAMQPDLKVKEEPLELTEMPIPEPGQNEVLIQVAACGICRTELDQIEGRILPPRLPIILGHQPIGIVHDVGSDVTRFGIGDRAGVAWIFSSCGSCKFCLSGQENLCQQFKATGCHADGGYAEYMVVSEQYAYKIPDGIAQPEKAAPLMCAGAVGFRSLKLTGMEDGNTLGLYGFGSAHHLVLQMANAKFPNSKKFVITRNPKERELAKTLGADWVGDIDDGTPQRLDCTIDSTPAWKPTINALGNLERGGRLIINLIRKEAADKEELLKLDYANHLWLEKEIKTVANITRIDVEQFLALVSTIQINPEVQRFRLEEANKALVELKSGKIRGSKVLTMK